MKTKQRVVILGSLIGLTTLYGVSLATMRVLADNDVVDNVNVTVPSACSMNADGMDTHNTDINNGIYKENIGTTIIQAFCNDGEGFSVYAVGFTDDEFGKTVLTSSRLGPSHDIITGTATSAGNPDISNWSMKVQTNPNASFPATIDNDFEDYHVVPDNYTRIIFRENPTDVGTSAVGATFTTTYSAYISKTQLAGTYRGQVKYTLVHPASDLPVEPQDTPPGYIGYYPNASRIVDTMGDQALDSADTSATLWASNFKRAGYGFAGWSTTYDYSDPNGFYGPNEEIDFEAGAYTDENPGLSLYAYWIKSAGTMQEWDGCENMNIGEITALTDNRDDETYAIAKLADGKCWTIENLRTGHSAEITTTNTDTSAGAFGGVFTTLAEPEIENFNNGGVANSLYSTDGLGGNYPAYRIPRYNDNNTRIGSVSAEMTAPSDNVNSYGHYYTWSSAIADTSYYPDDNVLADQSSLCPASWTLPVAGNDNYNSRNNYLLLSNAVVGELPNDNWIANRSRYYNKEGSSIGTLASKAMRSFPNNFIYSGNISGSSNSGKGVNGYYWTSTNASSHYAYSFNLNANAVYPGTNFSAKTDGISIRCIKK